MGVNNSQSLRMHEIAAAWKKAIYDLTLQTTAN